MATETIREFLVSLGFKSDESALKKFEDGIGKATKAVFSLATAIEATAIAVSAAVARWASNLEALYFAAQRTGSSVVSLKALDLAARNLGANAGEAQSAVEGLASVLRQNPGNVGALQGILAQVGLQLKFNADGSIDATDALLKLSEAFKQMPDVQIYNFSKLLGLNGDLMWRLSKGGLVDEYRKALAELGKGGFDQAAEHAHQFMTDLRDLQAQLEVFGIQVQDAIQQKLGISLKDIRAWLEKNGPWLAGRVAEVAKAIIDAAIKIGEKIAWVIDKLKEWDEKTDGLSTKLIALALLLKVSGAGSIIGGIGTLAGAIAAISSTAGLAAISIASVTTAVYALYNAMHGKDASNWVSDLVNSLGGMITGKKGWSLGGSIFDFFHRGQSAYDFFRNRGWSQSAATGIVANLQAESGFHPGAEGDNGQAYGLAQWHKDRQIDFKRLFGHDIRDSSFEEQLSFVDAELRNRPEFGGAMLRAAQNSEAAARIVSQYYERPADAVGEANRRAAIASNLSQQTTIHVNGAGDAQAVADRVAEEQKRVNAELARNFANAVQ